MHGFSSTFAKAFATPDQGPFTTSPYIYNFAVKPTLPDGFVLCGEGGATTVESMAFMPFCDASPGTLLRVRMIYWNSIGGDPDRRTWLGVPIVEVLCTVSNACGTDPNVPGIQPLGTTDRFCDNIVLTAGNLGLTGTIYSFGAGTDLPAMVNAEIQGARLISFDTQAEDAQGNYLPGVNGNVLWAKFS